MDCIFVLPDFAKIQFMMCTWELRQGGPQQVFIVVRVQIFTLQAASELLFVSCGHWREAKQQNVRQLA